MQTSYNSKIHILFQRNNWYIIYTFIEANATTQRRLASRVRDSNTACLYIYVYIYIGHSFRSQQEARNEQLIYRIANIHTAKDTTRVSSH